MRLSTDPGTISSSDIGLYDQEILSRSRQQDRRLPFRQPLATNGDRLPIRHAIVRCVPHLLHRASRHYLLCEVVQPISVVSNQEFGLSEKALRRHTPQVSKVPPRSLVFKHLNPVRVPVLRGG